VLGMRMQHQQHVGWPGQVKHQLAADPQEHIWSDSDAVVIGWGASKLLFRETALLCACWNAGCPAVEPIMNRLAGLLRIGQCGG
jgi:hypothetical protein